MEPVLGPTWREFTTPISRSLEAVRSEEGTWCAADDTMHVDPRRRGCAVMTATHASTRDSVTGVGYSAAVAQRDNQQVQVQVQVQAAVGAA